MAHSKEGRILDIEIFRFNPQIPDTEPHMVHYQIQEQPGMTIFIALNLIREQQDPSLQFDFVCRAGICGSCGMIINGLPKLACRTLTSSFPKGKIELMPMPAFELIGDLSVNTGKAMREMSEKVESWLHDPEQDQVDLTRLEAPMDPQLAEEIYELDRCIECGICLAACGTKRMRNDFIGAAAMMRISRFMLDPRDKRTDEDYYDVLANEKGVFGCMTLLGCDDYCPKELPHQHQIAYLRRKMVSLK